MRRFMLGMLWIVGLGILTFADAPSAKAAEEKLCFDETGYCIGGRFRQYWEQNGGLPVFGYPISDEYPYPNPDTGQYATTQWFQRNRFELYPGNQAPYDVLLGRLGDEVFSFTYSDDWHDLPRDPAPQNGCLWFAQTGRNVCDLGSGVGFKTYWETHGLEFDGRSGKSYEESLALFGLPITPANMETNQSGDTVITQWFERARFEWHPNNPDQFKVLLGLLGDEYPTEDEPVPTPAPEPIPTPAPADPCANIAEPRFAAISPNCLYVGELFDYVVYGFEANQEISIWITLADGGTVGTSRTEVTDEDGAFFGAISTAEWGMPPGDYVLVAQEIAAEFEPSTAPFRVLP